MKYSTILFDLDGTLTDPFEGITKSVQYAAQHFGYDEPELENLRHFIGPPLREELRDTYNLTEEESYEAISLYRERFSTVGLFENKMFDGVPELLSALKQNGATLAIASSKPQKYVLQILEHFDILKYFNLVVGSEMDGTRTNKSECVAYALQLLGNIDLTHTVMIGDRYHDAHGALDSKIDVIAAGYGFSEDGEFENLPHVAIANSISELHDILI